MRSFAVLVVAGAAVLGAERAGAQQEGSTAPPRYRFAVEAFLGTALNVPSPLRLAQTGEPDLSFTGRYDTKPLQMPVYWNVRLSLLSDRRAFELQFTQEVQQFEITHGFNLFTLAYAWRGLPVDLRAGAGVVLPHASGTVRDRPFEAEGGGFLGRGWHKAGPALLAGAGKRWEPVRHLLLVVDAELTAAWARSVPVTGGAYDVDGYAVHLRLGVGYAF